VRLDQTLISHLEEISLLLLNYSKLLANNQEQKIQIKRDLERICTPTSMASKKGRFSFNIRISKLLRPENGNIKDQTNQAIRKEEME